MASPGQRSALSNVLRNSMPEDAPIHVGSLPPSAALPVPNRWGHADVAVDILSSSSRGGSGVFGASPTWDASPSCDSYSYGTSPLFGTPFPYLVRVPGPRHAPRLHRQSSYASEVHHLSLPTQHEQQEEGEEGEREEEEEAHPAAAAAAASLPPTYPRTEPREAAAGGAQQRGADTAAAAAKQPKDGGLTMPLLASARAEAQSPPAAAAKPKRGGYDMPRTPLSRSLVFGAINSIATIPTLIAFAAIVFKEPMYAPYLDLLCKFFFLASAVHQAVFCVLSSLPYAIGQVQDVGLIFLSAMASSIAMLCEEAGLDAATALGTSLLTMTVSTFLVGLGTLAVAKFKLAGLVQYLPLPVVGGYLGFVGYFCIASGIGLGCGVQIDTIPSWVGLTSWGALGKLLPTLGSCAAMMLTLEHVTHPLALPGVMVAINLAFHATLLALGIPLEQAQAQGWAMPATEGGQKFWELWGLFNIRSFSLDGVYLDAALMQIGKFFGLYLVVCFGSCMDIAAIQQDTPQKIDFDAELTTVAVSNMVTGLMGCGYTGSYIFSQTVFTMRAGVFSRWNGAVVVLSELALFALPFSVVQYMPNFFFGALLLWFGIEISRDWLVLSFRKLTATEYVLLWLSFATIMQLGLEMGIGVGIVMAALYFTYAYAKSQVTSLGLVHMRSGVVRTLEQQAALDLFDGRLVTARLRGFVFFGSANSIGAKLHQAAQGLVEGDSSEVQPMASVEEAIDHSRRSVGEGYEALKLAQTLEALSRAPRYMILDFTHATGLDATGARTFGMLCRDLLELGITPLMTGAREGSGVRELLQAHGMPLAAMRWPPPLPMVGDGYEGTTYSFSGSGSQLLNQRALSGGLDEDQGEEEWKCCDFPTLEEGLRYCEDHFVEVAVECGLCPSPTARVTLEALLRSHLPKVPFSASADASQMAHRLLQYFSRRVVQAGEYLWQRGDAARECYIIEKGSMRLITYEDDEVRAEVRQLRQELPGVRHAAGSRSHAICTHEYGPGCCVGALDLYLLRPRSSDALALAPAGCRLLRLSRTKLVAMAGEAPQALNVVQAVLMRAICRDLSVAMEAGAGQPGGD